MRLDPIGRHACANRRETLLLLSLCTGIVLADDPLFEVTTRRENDRVDFVLDADEVLLEIRSPLGISDAKIERRSDSWPKIVELRLHLKYLEHFQADSGTIKLNASVSSGGERRVRTWVNDKEIAPQNSLAVMVSRSDDGYFDIALPAKFFASNPKSIKLSWVDAYRN